VRLQRAAGRSPEHTITLMRAVVVTRHGGPEVLELRDVPDPTAGEGELLVDVEAAGVNFRDVYEREGAYPGDPPFVAGAEAAGVVAATGERVAWKAGAGSYAERAAVPEREAVPVPEGVSTEVAAAILLQGTTAHYLAASTYPVQAGDVVLVHAAAGGVGQLLTQIVKLRGGRVIATTSTDEKAAVARDVGADETIGYDGFAERVRELTDGEGVVAVYDGIGRTTFDESLASLRPRGAMVLYGSASGWPDPIDARRLAADSLFLTRPMLHHYASTRDELLARAADVFDWVRAGKLRVQIGGRYPLEEARRAQVDLASRRTTGKLLLVP
jgi:NADPH2:quinone reductase